MKVTMTGFTIEANSASPDFNIDNLKAFAGKQGALCYAEDSYFGERIQNHEKAVKRFNQIIPTLHHSIADHCNISILIEDIPKIGAMVLNSLSQYATSEKSGRYTKMTGSSQEEINLYEKWVEIYTYLISETYPQIDKKTVNKLAMENARYVLSVFTPTTLAYTTTIRQFNYILDWVNLFNEMAETPFEKRVAEAMNEFAEQMSFIRIDGLRDAKHRTFKFFVPENRIASENFGGECYTVNYQMSFAGIAQAQRHRTLSYKMNIPANPNCYIPPILKGTQYENEWISDFEKVKDVFPQGTLVNVCESGKVEDFFLKTQERICGRAQLEIAHSTNAIFNKMFNNKENYDGYLCEMIASADSSNGEFAHNCKAKCQFSGSCKETCVWGAKNALTRKI